jgi:isoquinoline 1-oxidoreductase beta subunit
MDLPVPDPASVKLRDPSQFRWIGKPVRRLDAYDKSTGKAQYCIDIKVDGMLHAAVQHAPRLGMTVGSLRNEDQVKAMKGVHSVHQLPGAVAVVAERWWHAKRAVEALQVDWQEPTADSKSAMPADFPATPGANTWPRSRARPVMKKMKAMWPAPWQCQDQGRGQLPQPIPQPCPAGAAVGPRPLQPGRHLDVWLPNQAPDMFRDDIAKRTGLSPRRSTCTRRYRGSLAGISCTTRPTLTRRPLPWPKRVGRPVKLIWSREEEFLRDVLRPVAGEVPRRAGCRRHASGPRSDKRHRRPNRGHRRQTGGQDRPDRA